MDVAGVVLNSITIVTVLLGGGWILRLYGERERTIKQSHASQQQAWQSQKALLDERLKFKDEQLQSGLLHVRQMAELNQGNEKHLQRQLEALQRQAGVDPEAPLSEAPPAIPAEIQQNMLEILGQLKDIRTVVDQRAPAATAAPLRAKDHLLRGHAYYTAGQFGEALASYDRSLELGPDDAITLMNRGVTLRHLERYEEALASYNRSLKLQPDDADTLMNRGITLRYLERYDEALADYTRSLELGPDDPVTLYNRGITLRHLRRYDEALADYTRSLELRPDNPDVLGNMASLWSAQGQQDTALDSATRAIQADPQHANNHLIRANILSRLDRYEEALVDYNRSLELRPDDPDTLERRAAVLRNLGHE